MRYRCRAPVALLAAALAPPRPLGAAGPVFVVVSSSPHGSGGALTQAKQQRTRIDRALAHARELAASAPLLSDRLDAQSAVAQLETAGTRVDDNVSQLEEQVTALEQDSRPAPAAEPAAPALPQPVTPAVPAFDPFSAAPSLGVQAAQSALQYLGVPYVWGGADPVTGFDCSGLVQYVYGQLGIGLAHYTGTQLTEGTPVQPSDLRPGDLVFFEPGVAGPGHVGIYIGSGEVVEAPHTGAVVQVSSFATMSAQDGFVGAVRPYVTPSAYGGF